MVAALIADGFRNYLRAGHRKPAEELPSSPSQRIGDASRCDQDLRWRM